jgi:hypothetical protein
MAKPGFAMALQIKRYSLSAPIVDKKGKGINMGSFQKDMNEYRKQLEKGAVQAAYKGLMQYIMDLRTYFKHKYPDYFVSGSIYHGYMDMTYFSFISKPLKGRKLKTAIVFLHESFRFEVWLGGYNKKVQSAYWKQFRESGWRKYHIVPAIKGIDSILEYILVDNPDFSDLDALTRIIEKGTLKFMKDVEKYLLSKN